MKNKLSRLKPDEPEFKIGDWCVFMERGAKHYIVDIFVNTETYQKDGANTKCSKHWAKHTDTWFHNVYPLKFIETLKDS